MATPSSPSISFPILWALSAPAVPSKSQLKADLRVILASEGMLPIKSLCSSKWSLSKRKDVKSIKKDLGLEGRIEQMEKRISELKVLKKSESEPEKLEEILRDVKGACVELSQIRKNRRRSKINYLLYKNFFIKKSLQLLACKPPTPILRYTLIKEKDRLFHQMVHSALKSYVHVETEELQKKYGGSLSGLQATIRCQSSFSVLNHVIHTSKPIPGLTGKKEKEGLRRICELRANIVRYENLYEEIRETLDLEAKKKKIDQLVENVIANIDALESSSSPHSVVLENGDKTFVIPGGWNCGDMGHYVSFQMTKDTHGDYYFTIHNRGANVQDKRLHSTLSFVIGNKTYYKTIVPIKIRKDLIKDKDFILTLVNKRMSGTGEDVYNKIYEHLIEKGGGELILSEQEKLVAPLYEFLTCSFAHFPEVRQKICHLFIRLLHSDPHYHSVQKFGTCSESNLVTLEKNENVAPRQVLRILKQHDLARLMRDVARKYFFNCFSLYKLDQNSTIEEYLKVVQQLEQRLPQEHLIFKKIFGCSELQTIRETLNFFQISDQIIHHYRGKISSYEAWPRTSVVEEQIEFFKNLIRNEEEHPQAQEELNEVIQRYCGFVKEIRILYIHTGKKLKELQEKLKSPPKEVEKATPEEVRCLIAEAIFKLVSQAMEEKNLATTTITGGKLIDFFYRDLNALKAHYADIDNHFSKEIFYLAYPHFLETLAKNRSLLECQKGKFNEEEWEDLIEKFLDVEKELHYYRALRSSLQTTKKGFDVAKEGLEFARKIPIDKGQVNIFKEIFIKNFSVEETEKFFSTIPLEIRPLLFSELEKYFSQNKMDEKAAVFG